MGWQGRQLQALSVARQSCSALSQDHAVGQTSDCSGHGLHRSRAVRIHAPCCQADRSRRRSFATGYGQQPTQYPGSPGTCGGGCGIGPQVLIAASETAVSAQPLRKPHHTPWCGFFFAMGNAAPAGCQYCVQSPLVTLHVDTPMLRHQCLDSAVRTFDP